MQSDLPHTLYIREKGKKGRKKGDDYKFNPNDRAMAKQMEAIKKRREKVTEQVKEPSFTTDELFK